MTSLRFFTQRAFYLLVSLAALLSPTAADATLGENADSVEQVRQTFSATRHAARVTPSYTVHEVANDGLTIREYANSDGQIFAVAWSGVSHPSMADLLGTYLGDFHQANANAPRARGRVPYAEVHGSKVIVIKSGHMRNVHGRAYLPNLLPSGVTADELN